MSNMNKAKQLCKELEEQVEELRKVNYKIGVVTMALAIEEQVRRDCHFSCSDKHRIIGLIEREFEGVIEKEEKR